MENIIFVSAITGEGMKKLEETINKILKE